MPFLELAVRRLYLRIGHILAWKQNKDFVVYLFYKELKTCIMEAVGKLTNVQIELLKLFQYNLPEKQLLEIKNILAKYFSASATEEMDKLWEEKGWNNNTMDEWANEHLRK